MDDNLTMAVTVDLDPVENLHVDLNYVGGTEGDGTHSSGIEDDDTTDTDAIEFVDLSNYSISIIDASILYKVNDMFNVALNYISNTITPQIGGSEGINSTSLAAYINARYNRLNFGLRYEQFSFDLAKRGGAVNGLLYNGSDIGLKGEGEDNSLSSITVSIKTEIARNADFLLEYRMDTADDESFFNADGESADSFNRITAALMYRF